MKDAESTLWYNAYKCLLTQKEVAMLVLLSINLFLSDFFFFFSLRLAIVEIGFLY